MPDNIGSAGLARDRSHSVKSLDFVLLWQMKMEPRRRIMWHIRGNSDDSLPKGCSDSFSRKQRGWKDELYTQKSRLGKTH